MAFVLLFLIGFGLAVTGGVTLIAYLNFLPAGISWYEYVEFITGRVETYFLPAGFLLIIIALSILPSKS